MRATPAITHAVAVALLAVAALVQLGLPGREASPGPWFLFGTDTVTHDALVQLWVRQAMLDHPTTVPLWMAPLHGGLPVLGAYLWTPFAPQVWTHDLLEYPAAQRAAWWATLAIAGWGAYAACVAMRLRFLPALLGGVAWMLSGHLVTLIHAGHFQKVMALAWLGWGVAGLVWSARRDPTTALRGVAVAGGALGMMLVSGHPQIAYAMVALAVCFAAGLATLRRTARGAGRAAAALAGVIVIGGLLGGAQTLPGVEMSRVSNRAGGVSFAEATETSYPPRELLEFVAPRFLGSNTPADEFRYRGRWGSERIVSDHASAGVVIAAIVAIACSRRRPTTLFLLATLLAGAVIGLGRHTPVYPFLHEHLPGFSSFRSPATFFCVPALALALLAAIGLETLMRRDGRGPLFIAVVATVSVAGLALPVHRFRLLANKPALVPFDATVTYNALVAGVFLLMSCRGAWRWAGTMTRPVVLGGGVLLVLATGIILGRANLAFLRPESWEQFAGWLMMNDADHHLFHRLAPPRRVSFTDNDLSLRPMLLGFDALNGYHPITFAAKSAADARLGWHSDAWRTLFGVQAEVLRGGQGAERPDLYQAFVVAGVFVRALSGNAPIRARDASGAALPIDAKVRWDGPNRLVVAVGQPGPTREGILEVALTEAPGWVLESGPGAPAEARAVSLVREVPLPSAPSVEYVWSYRPRSYRVGLFLSALGVALAAFALAWRVPGRRRDG